MMHSPAQKQQRRYSLWQTLVALAALGFLAYTLAPDLAGLLRSGEQKAYDADRRLLSVAVDSWRTGEGAEASTRAWPTLDGTIGVPAPPSRSFIDVGLLGATHLLKGSDAIPSADTARNFTATNNPSGSYGWFIDSDGSVSSVPPFDGKYP